MCWSVPATWVADMDVCCDLRVNAECLCFHCIGRVQSSVAWKDVMQLAAHPNLLCTGLHGRNLSSSWSTHVETTGAKMTINNGGLRSTCLLHELLVVLLIATAMVRQEQSVAWNYT